MINRIDYKTNKEYIDALYDKGFEYMRNSTPLKKIVEEELTEWSLEEMRITETMQADFAIIPHGEYMILAYDRYNPNREKHSIQPRIGEYAIYRQIDRDGRNIKDSLNYNADYKLQFVGEQEFRNMGEAICFAVNLLNDMEGRMNHG